MQIEETFRDLKIHCWGFGLRYAQTASPIRLELLLLVKMLATFMLWLPELAATARQWIRHFQTNTERRRAVLSTVFLGRELLRSHRLKLDYRELSDAFERLENMGISQNTLLGGCRVIWIPFAKDVSAP
jgi:hypothetical protein